MRQDENMRHEKNGQVHQHLWVIGNKLSANMCKSLSMIESLYSILVLATALNCSSSSIKKSTVINHSDLHDLLHHPPTN